jgi:hypothetical protein
VVANSEVLASLTEEQRTALQRAAEATQAWSLHRATSDAEAAAAFCRNGGTVVLADDADLRALQHLTRPVYDALADDTVTGELIAGIEQVRASAATDPDPVACDGSADLSGTASGDGDLGDFPEGVYRIDISVEELVAAGAGEAWAGDVAGQWTLTFEGGRLTSTDVNARSGLSFTGHGAYCVDDGLLSFDLFGDEDDCGDGVYFSAGWRADDDGLRFVDVKPAPDQVAADVSALYGVKEWRKIG